MSKSKSASASTVASKAKKTIVSEVVIEDFEDSTNIEEEYQTKTHLQHIMDLPDTYIGGTQKERAFRWIKGFAQDGKACFLYKEIEFQPGLMQIIEEILVNAFDNRSRIIQKKLAGIKGLKQSTYIKVNVDKATGEISICNDGEGIDVVIHPKEGVYVPELIFGKLLSSGNYKKEEKKITGGKNGYGAKLTNIFSTKFTVETADRKRKIHFIQEFSKNMSERQAPEITEKYTGEIYTKITFTPDYKIFGCSGLTDQLIALIEKRTYDMVACSSGELKMWFNGVEVGASSFDDYISMYVGEQERAVIRVNERWEIATTLANNHSFEQVSFVNGINTDRGGRHVDYITKQITAGAVEYIKKKKKVDIREDVIKSNIFVFISAIIENPSFDSQTKNTLTTTKSNFGSDCAVPDKFIEDLCNSGLMERAIALSEFRDKQLLTKTDGKKIKRILDIPKLDDARFAGTKRSGECTLILTEGDSAKATAVAGVSVLENGRDFYGIFPLRGKLLNTRDKSEKDIVANAEIANIKKIIGLQEGKDYKDTSELRYGRVMFMTDADLDGSHIKGLGINFIDHSWESLIKIDGFLTTLLTPILKATKGKKVLNFYTQPAFEEWAEAHAGAKGWSVKYYKGLGTSTPAEAKEYFRDFKIVHYHWDTETKDSIDKAFNADRADDRKIWLTAYDHKLILDLNQNRVSYTDFINKDLIHYSNADNIRSIPSICDGLKPSQRKVMYCCFKRNLKTEIKVSQLSGYISEHGAYHHGEVSLQGTIINMSQNFCGANNINLLVPQGQFGTRLQGGKDAAAPRYIFTFLPKLAYTLFNQLDEPLFKPIEDEGQLIEPEFYLPVLPMVLINGSDGIGTGWSTGVPQFNPVDIIENLKLLMAGSKPKEMLPWYRGFRGSVKKIGKNQWITRGIYKLEGADTVVITELPIGVWTQTVKDILVSLLNPAPPAKAAAKKKGEKPVAKKSPTRRTKALGGISADEPIIRDYAEYHTDTTCNFRIKFDSDILTQLLVEDPKTGITELEKLLHLTSRISCDKKLNLYDENRALRTFGSVEEILEHYYQLRLDFYGRRKAYMIPKMEEELLFIATRVRFILDVIAKKIRVNNQPKAKITEQLEVAGYPKMYEKRLMAIADMTETQRVGGNYDFLVGMPIYSLTSERIEELKAELTSLEEKLAILKSKTIQNLWTDDLKEIEKEFDGFMKSYYESMNLNADDFPAHTERASRKVNMKRIEKAKN